MEWREREKKEKKESRERVYSCNAAAAAARFLSVPLPWDLVARSIYALLLLASPPPPLRSSSPSCPSRIHIHAYVCTYAAILKLSSPAAVAIFRGKAFSSPSSQIARYNAQGERVGKSRGVSNGNASQTAASTLYVRLCMRQKIVRYALQCV